MGAGSWIRCPASLSPTLSGSIMIDVGLRQPGSTTFAHRVTAALGVFVVAVEWTGSLIDSGMGSWPILLPPDDPEGKFYDEFTVTLEFTGDPDDPNLAWGGDGFDGVQKFYVCDSEDNGASYPVTLPFEVTAGYQLWRQHITQPPASRGLRYWWDCAVADRWGLLEDGVFTATVTGPAGAMSASYTNADAVTETGGSFDSVEYNLELIASPGGTRPTFAAINGTFARIEAGLGGVADPAAAAVNSSNGDWHVTGDAAGVSWTYDGAPTQAGAVDWNLSSFLPAVVTPALAAYDTGGPNAEGRTDPQVVITGPTTPIEQGIADTDAFAVPGGTALAVTIDEAWAAANDELAEVERDPLDDLPTANNLPVKLDVPPPTFGVGSPYWEGPASVGVWSALDLMLGTRLLAAVGAVPWSSPSDTEQDVDLADFWAANKLRWSETGGHALSFDDIAHELLVEAADTDPVELVRTVRSDWPARQGITIPECYRITKANYHAPEDPEDFYDWTAFRYLALLVEADRYPLTVTVAVQFAQPVVSDNHLTGSARTDGYAVSYAPGLFEAEVAVEGPGWHTVDMWPLNPPPRLVGEVRLTVEGLQAEDTFTLQTLGVSQDMPAENRDAGTLPDDRAWLKWHQIWDGSETIAVARVDGRPGLNVLDRYLRRNEVMGVPAIEWLWGAETGADLSRALTMAETLGLVAVQEGWRSTWDDGAWEDETTCVVDSVTRYLSDGYPWDVEWEAGTLIDGADLFPLRSCIGARSWRLAGGLAYSLYGQWFARGRLDGMLVTGEEAARDEAGGVTVTGGDVDEEVGSNAHGQWWSPALAEATGDPLAAIGYTLTAADGEFGSANAGATEWIRVGPARALASNLDLITTLWGKAVLSRPGALAWPTGGGYGGAGLALDQYSPHAAGGQGPELSRRLTSTRRRGAIESLPDGRIWLVAVTATGLALGLTDATGRSTTDVATLAGHDDPDLAADPHTGGLWMTSRRTADDHLVVHILTRATPTADPDFGEVGDLGAVDPGGGAVAVLPDGAVLVARAEGGTIHVHRSDDQGRTWSELT